jgi:type III restriction enzyme
MRDAQIGSSDRPCGRPNRAPTQLRSSVQGPQRQDHQPSHESEGKAEEAGYGRHGLPRVRRERKGDQRRGSRGTEADLGDLTFEDVKAAFQGLERLPIGKLRQKEIRYEGRHLITNEVIEQMRIKLPLLSDPVGAISFYREELERAVKVRGTHSKLAPLIQRFVEELLFEEPVDLYDERVVGRLAEADVQEYIRATFVPLLLKHVTRRQERIVVEAPQSVTHWLPYQATHSERHPAEIAGRTPFNLVPCNRQLEVAMTHFLDRASDVAAFAKNQGPQCLRVDSLTVEGRRSLYTPDFLVRKTNGHYVLAETKGRADRDVSGKARGAVEWCKAASTNQVKWEYLYVPQAIFEDFGGETVAELTRACAPALKGLLKEAESPQLSLPLSLTDDETTVRQLHEFIAKKDLDVLPARTRTSVEHSVLLFNFMANKEKVAFPPVFQPLLGPIDASAEALLHERLGSVVPDDPEAIERFFEPDLSGEKKKHQQFLNNQASVLKRLLVHRSPIMPVGILRFCLDYAKKDAEAPTGILAAVRTRFDDLAGTDLAALLGDVYDFRNTYIAHVKADLTARDEAEAALRRWIELVVHLHEAAERAPLAGPAH